MKSLASSMLLLWVLCWAHCSLSRYGVVMGTDACTCCTAAHEHAEESQTHADDHNAPGHATVECAVCDFLTNGATLMQKLPPMAALTLEFLTPATWEPTAHSVAIQVFTAKVPHDPPPLPDLCEMLSSTACPVRGPSAA